MSASDPVRPSGPPPGLCAGCRHSRRIETGRGSVFRLCELSSRDPRYPRYPVLPVLRCAGFGAVSPVEPAWNHWAVPGLVLSVPGLLLVLAIAAQALGALAWLPLVRRRIGGFGLRGARGGPRS